MYLCAAETTLNRRALLAAGCLCLRVDAGKQSDVHMSLTARLTERSQQAAGIVHLREVTECFQ